MTEYAELHENLKTCTCPKCAATATKLENSMVDLYKEKYVYEKFYGQIIYYAKHLRPFWRNESCKYYCQRKIQARQSSNDVHVPRLCKK